MRRLRLISSVVSGLRGIWRGSEDTRLHLGSVSFGHSPPALGDRQGYLNQLPGSTHGFDPESSKGAAEIVGHSTYAVLLVPVSSEELQLSVG